MKLTKHLLIAAATLFATQVDAQLKMPKLISDNMVFQRNAEMNIWGWASAGEKVTVNFKNADYTTTTAENGKWRVTIPSQPAGGPYNITICASDTIVINNVLIGDVWLCSGQSNMELPIRRVEWIYPGVVENANNQNVRYTKVPDRYNFHAPQEDLDGGKWLTVSPQTVGQFGALTYFFADELSRDLNIPIGIMNVSLGGSPIESWISEEELKAYPVAYNELKRMQNDSLTAQINKTDNEKSNAWYSELAKLDLGYKNHWESPETNIESWETAIVPGTWCCFDTVQSAGALWFAKRIILSAEQAASVQKIIMGVIVDADEVYINGEKVGSTGYQYPPRRYNIPEGLMHEGENYIAVRAVENSANGEFVTDKDYILQLKNDTIDLSGEWKFRRASTIRNAPSSAFLRWKPAGLYNGMLAPALGFSYTGAIWYQGESNAGRDKEYTPLLKTLISSWRKDLNNNNLPFIVIQLPNFMQEVAEPSNGTWARMRQAQADAANQSENTSLVCAIDLGEWNDIHPLNKKDLAHRVYLQAKSKAYADNKVIADAPTATKLTVKGNKATVEFTNCGSGLVTTDGKAPTAFAIAGADGKYYWADAQLIDNKVVVSSKKVKKPVSVRYAWADNPGKINLYSKEGLPAFPFSITK